MTAVFDHPIDHPAAWRGCDFAGKADFAVPLSETELAVLEQATESVAGRPLDEIDKKIFDLAPIAARVAAWRRIILEGRGLLVLQGFPVQRRDADFIARMYWGLGRHLGRPVSQSTMGDRMGHVINVSGDNPAERGYRSKRELSFHTDSDDIVGLLCLRQARSGGESKLVSALAVHNALLLRRPELLAPLYRGFRYHWRGEQAPGEPPITEYRVPVFSQCDGVISVCYLRHFIEMAAEDLGEPLSSAESAALDAFDECCEDPDLKVEFTLDQGEVLFFNNYTTLHARNAFEEHAGGRRHLLRLWLKDPGARPVAAALGRYYGEDGLPKQEGKGTLYEPEPQTNRDGEGAQPEG